MAEKALGDIAAQAFVALIADIEAFDNAAELLELRANEIQLAGKDSLFVRFGSKYRCEFSAVGSRFGHDERGAVNWAMVTRLKLLQILPTQ